MFRRIDYTRKSTGRYSILNNRPLLNIFFPNNTVEYFNLLSLCGLLFSRASSRVSKTWMTLSTSTSWFADISLKNWTKKILTLTWGASKNGAVVRSWTRLTPRCPGLKSLPAISGLTLLLVLYFAPRAFCPGAGVFPSHKKTTFPNFNSTRNDRRRITTWMCYL